MLTVHAKLGKVVGVIICMHWWKSVYHWIAALYLKAMWLDSTTQTFCKCFQTFCIGHYSSQTKACAKGIACNLFDARAEHLKQLDFNSLKQSQIQLSKVNPMIPFVDSIRNQRDMLSTDLTETMVYTLLFHHFHSRYQYMVRTLTFIALLTIWLVMKSLIWTKSILHIHMKMSQFIMMLATTN